MATPLAGIPIPTQVAQTRLNDPAQAAQKTGMSKFDSMLADKAGGVQGANAVQAPQAANAVNRTQATDKVTGIDKADKAALNKATDVVTAKQDTHRITQNLSRMVADMEKGQGVLDKLIQGGVSGKKFNNTELLALQASMYKYTQELELTGKVVEKATTGLKDTLKTQV